MFQLGMELLRETDRDKLADLVSLYNDVKIWWERAITGKHNL